MKLRESARDTPAAVVITLSVFRVRVVYSMPAKPAQTAVRRPITRDQALEICRARYFVDSVASASHPRQGGGYSGVLLTGPPVCQ